MARRKRARHDASMSESRDPRVVLQRVAQEQGKSLSELSVRIGRNVSYLGQYVARGSPRRLPEDERRHLAITLGIDERRLGARDPWCPPA